MLPPPPFSAPPRPLDPPGGGGGGAPPPGSAPSPLEGYLYPGPPSAGGRLPPLPLPSPRQILHAELALVVVHPRGTIAHSGNFEGHSVVGNRWENAPRNSEGYSHCPSMGPWL